VGLAILIADDNELNRWLLTEQLQGLQVDVAQTSNGVEAWEQLQTKSFYMAFFDLNMPLMGGRELLAKIRQHATLKALYCVAVTAHAQSDLRQRLLEEGFDDCLIKPIVLADLQRVVAQPINSSANLDAERYACMLLDRTADNRELAQLLLNKLFDQVPEQFDRLHQQLHNKHVQGAWEVAHQLHGTFCFYGFEDFRTLAQTLEQSLLNAKDTSDAHAKLQLLQAKFAALTAEQSALLKWVK